MPTQTKLPNIIIAAIDTLRPDHLGCYGYTRATSPHIDALANESIVFDKAFAAAIPTMPSFTTIYSGQHSYCHGIVSHAGKHSLSHEKILLPQVMKENGYVTVALDNLVVQGGGSGNWFARGYDYYSGFVYKPFSDQSKKLTDQALLFLKKHLGSPLFLLIHYWDTHTPYGPLPPYDRMHYTPGSASIRMEEVKAIYPAYYSFLLRDMHLSYPNDYAYVVAQYDGEISQVDFEVGRLIEAIKAQGAWDDTIFIVLSDHGECFGEGSLYFDHHGLYDAVTHIALIFYIPGKQANHIEALVSTEDILPTLGEIIGIPHMPFPLTGVSLLPLLNGSNNEIRAYVVSAEATRQASLALRTPEWKVILPITEDIEGRPIPDFYGRTRNANPLLFNVKADPGEQYNLSFELPEILAEKLELLTKWRAEMQQMTGELDLIQCQGLSMPLEWFMQRIAARLQTVRQPFP